MSPARRHILRRRRYAAIVVFGSFAVVGWLLVDGTWFGTISFVFQALSAVSVADRILYETDRFGSEILRSFREVHLMALFGAAAVFLTILLYLAEASWLKTGNLPSSILDTLPADPDPRIFGLPSLAMFACAFSGGSLFFAMGNLSRLSQHRISRLLYGYMGKRLLPYSDSLSGLAILAGVLVFAYISFHAFAPSANFHPVMMTVHGVVSGLMLGLSIFCCIDWIFTYPRLWLASARCVLRMAAR